MDYDVRCHETLAEQNICSPFNRKLKRKERKKRWSFPFEPESRQLNSLRAAKQSKIIAANKTPP
jgi:hypothetical protein